MKADTLQLIETMRAENGVIPLLQGHLQRAAGSALQLQFAWQTRAARTAIMQSLQTLDPAHTYRVRLLCNKQGKLDIQTSVLPPTPEPVLLAWSPDTLDSQCWWLAHKTTCRPNYDTAQRWLDQHPHIFDLIFCNEHGNVCEGSKTTLYIQDNAGTWLTPPLSCGLLPGVQRQALLNSGQVQEATLTVTDVLQAPQLRVSNALRGWLNARLSR
jgi:4-amino-4-deoxychorismate lyase